jgi:UDP-glucose 4-epimerase
MQYILFTGATGFIGSNFIRKLRENLWFENSEKYILTSRDLDIPGFHIIKYESFSHLGEILPGVIFDVVFHIGAFTPKSRTDANLIEKSTSNILFTQHLLKSLTRRCRKIIYLSTLDVYSPEINNLDEESSISPISLYGTSKYYCEKLIEVWSRNENCTHQILRLGHIYGPGEDAYKKVIPLAMSNILKGNSIELWGEGNDRRSFLYIDDCSYMIYKSSQLEKFEGPINLASENSFTIRELVLKIIKLSNKSVKIVLRDTNSLPRNVMFNVAKMKLLLGCEQISLDEGLKREFEYFKILFENGKSE